MSDLTTRIELQHNITQFLYQEARFLDDEQWDDWLNCYAPSAEFWMPAWDDDDTLTTDPMQEISLIYYPETVKYSV